MKGTLFLAAAACLCCLAVFAEEESAVLKYHDGEAEGTQSLGGSGEMIEFTAPADSKVAGLRIHGSRYGSPRPPDEEFLIYFLSPDRRRILHTEMAPYELFERGEQKWVPVSFPEAVDVPENFWIVLDFRADQRKGVYVSYDTSTAGEHSRVGLPGTSAAETKFHGDWMIEAVLAE